MTRMTRCHVRERDSWVGSGHHCIQRHSWTLEEENLTMRMAAPPCGHGVMKQGVFKVYPVSSPRDLFKILTFQLCDFEWVPQGTFSKFKQFDSVIGWVSSLKSNEDKWRGSLFAIANNDNHLILISYYHQYDHHVWEDICRKKRFLSAIARIT